MRLSMASPFLNGSRSSKSLVMQAPETTKCWAVLVLLGDPIATHHSSLNLRFAAEQLPILRPPG